MTQTQTSLDNIRQMRLLQGQIESHLEWQRDYIERLEGLLKKVRNAGAKAAGINATDQDRDVLIELTMNLHWA